MARKRKQVFPPAKTATGGRARQGAGPDGVFNRPQHVTINLSASQGRAGLSVGDRVRIAGTGLYAGENAVITKLSRGPIPSALITTEGGQTRQVRTVDLEPITSSSEERPAS